MTVLSRDPVPEALEQLIDACIQAGMGAQAFSQLAKQAEKRIQVHHREQRIRELEALGRGAKVRYKAVARAETDATYVGRDPETSDMVRISTNTYNDKPLNSIRVDPLKVSPPNRR